MNQRDHLKLLRAGYTIIRCPLSDAPIIKVADPGTSFAAYSWKTLKKFATNAARDRFAREMLQDDKVIED